MRKAWIVAVSLLAVTLALPALSDQAGIRALQGSWKGPWYIGMSSGVAKMEIAADGSGKIGFSNLDSFGEQPAALTKTSFDGSTFRFSAVGAGGSEFSAGLQLRGEGRELRGNGKYGGFGARLELRRAD